MKTFLHTLLVFLLMFVVNVAVEGVLWYFFQILGLHLWLNGYLCGVTCLLLDLVIISISLSY